MDIKEILTYVGTLVGGGVLTQIGTEIYNWRKGQKELAKAEAEINGSYIDNMEAAIKKVYDPIINRLTNRLNEVEKELAEVRAENNRLQSENALLKQEQEKLKNENTALRKELDDIRSRAMFINRGKNGQFAKQKK